MSVVEKSSKSSLQTFLGPNIEFFIFWIMNNFPNEKILMQTIIDNIGKAHSICTSFFKNIMSILMLIVVFCRYKMYINDMQ